MRLSESKAIPCPFQEPCCMKENGKCTALTDTRFKDGKCHFRKLFPHSENEYDKERRTNEKRRFLR